MQKKKKSSGKACDMETSPDLEHPSHRTECTVHLNAGRNVTVLVTVADSRSQEGKGDREVAILGAPLPATHSFNIGRQWLLSCICSWEV